MTEEYRARLKIRIEKVTAALDEYYAAEIAILSGAQQYSLGSRSLTRANLATVQKSIVDLENLLARLQAEYNGQSRMRIVPIVPIDC